MIGMTTPEGVERGKQDAENEGRREHRHRRRSYPLERCRTSGGACS